MSGLITDKRNNKHCPGCKGQNIFFKLTPLPSIKNLIYICSDCEFQFIAKREEDKQEFKELAKEYQ